MGFLLRVIGAGSDWSLEVLLNQVITGGIILGALVKLWGNESILARVLAS